MRLRHLLLLGIPAYLVFLVLTLPATLVLGWLRPADAGWWLESVQGSVWCGEARRLHYAGLSLDNPEWRLRPLALLLGRVEYGLRVSGEAATVDARVGRALDGGFYLRDTHGRLAAALLTALVSGELLHAGGELQVELAALDYDQGPQSATGQLRWQAAALTDPMEISLGDFQLLLETKDEPGIHGVLTDTQGVIAVDARLSLHPDGRYELLGTLEPRANATDELRESLALLGRPDARGRYRLNYRGKL